MYIVYLRDIQTAKVRKLYAGKIVLESYLHNKNSDRRRENLRREIDLLQLAESTDSVTLIELIETDPDRTVIIQDYANGGSLFSLMETRHSKHRTVGEGEAQLIVRKLTSSLNGVYAKGIIHRDLNVNNVLLHFPCLEPSQEELQDPRVLEKLAKRRKAIIKDDLLKEQF